MLEKNEKLIQDLRDEMDAELEKSAEEMDTDKIRHIVQLLKDLEQWESFPEDLEQEKFFEEFDKKYGIDMSEARAAANGTKKVKHSVWKWKTATVAAGVVLAIGIGNAATGLAVDKSLWQLVRENSHIAYFHVIGKDNESNKEEEFVEAQYEKYDDWESLNEAMEELILIPEYVPEGLKLESIEKMTMESYVSVMADYQGENAYLNFSCTCYKEVGAYGNNAVGKETVGKYISIGDKDVQMRKEEEINISFTDNDIFYSIDTDLGMDEVEKFIENLK